MQRRASETPALHRVKLRALRVRKYGIEIAAFDHKYEEQGGCCKVCQKPFADKSKACIDHDHATGFVRALLCRWCNAALGIVDDDVFLAKLVEYRDRYRQIQEATCPSK